MGARTGSLPPLALGVAALAGIVALLVTIPLLVIIAAAGTGWGAGGRGADASDAAALDEWMQAKVPSSPLVGLGHAFVASGLAHGVDPRALVAIAHHESVLGTAGSGASINNAFGWGPGIPFPSWEANIETVARGLARGYIARGLDTLAEIQPVWAPVGAANDPTGLNSHWLRAVGGYYAELGGDPIASIALTAGALAGDVQRALCPHGGWGGTQGPIEALVRLTGIAPSSLKRDRRHTASGGVSDHYVGCLQCYAADLPTTPPAGDLPASRIAAAIAGPSHADWGRRGGVLNAERCGIRFNLLWRTMVGGDHYDHIHIGARRVGYAP